MKRRIISCLLTVVLLLSAVSVFAFAAHPVSGAANSNNTATWSFDAATGTITFSGENNASLYSLTTQEKNELAPKIKKAVFGEGITTVSSSALENCTNLTSVVFPSTLTTIYSRAFYGCSSLTALTVPATVNWLGDAVFANSKATVTIASGNKYYKNVGNLIYSADNKTLVYYPSFRQDAEFVIPSGVVDIDEAFVDNGFIKKVTIPASVLTARNAFTGCTSLKTVNFSEGMVLIPSYICYGVTSLESVTIPSTVKEIQYCAFEQTGLKSAIVPEGVKVIEDYAFYKCENLKEVKFPSTLESVGYDVVKGTAFYKDASKWENNVLYVGSCVVDSKYDLTGSYTIKNGTKLIAEYAFSFSNITAVTIPDSVKYICDYAFNGADTLASVNSNGSFIWVGKNTVADTAYAKNEKNWKNGGLYIGKALVMASDEIVSLTVLDGTVVIADRAAYARKKLEFVGIPGSVKTIGEYAFYDCDALKTIKLNSGIERFGECAFYDCDAVKELVIPEGVKVLGEDAVDGMNALEKITLPKSLEEIVLDEEYPSSPWSSVNLKQVTVNGTYAQMVKLGIAEYVERHVDYGVKYVFVGGYGNIVPAWEVKDTSTIFNDVKAGKWYKNAIDYAYNNGFISGMTANSFGLNTSITRGMFVTIIARIAGTDTSKAANKKAPKIFADVPTGKYFSAAVVWAKNNGVASGKSATTFEPETAISRQELCVMISNFAKYMKIELTAVEPEIAFSDNAAISKWAKKAVLACQKADIVNGYAAGGKTEFRPVNTATRAEAAQILYKFHKDYVVSK